MNFGKKVHVMRVLRGLKQSELGSMAALRQDQISDIELGKRIPTIVEAVSLRRALAWEDDADAALAALAEV